MHNAIESCVYDIFEGEKANDMGTLLNRSIALISLHLRGVNRTPQRRPDYGQIWLSSGPKSLVHPAPLVVERVCIEAHYLRIRRCSLLENLLIQGHSAISFNGSKRHPMEIIHIPGSLMLKAYKRDIPKGIFQKKKVISDT